MLSNSLSKTCWMVYEVPVSVSNNGVPLIERVWFPNLLSWHASGTRLLLSKTAQLE